MTNRIWPHTALPGRIVAIALLVWIVAPPSAARAVIVLRKGDRPAIKGFLVRESPDTVVVDVPQPDGTRKEEVLQSDEVDVVIRTVSTDRLTTLKPDTPQAYRDYAEELAEKREDPEAREAALRLYLIAAYLDPDKLGRSCLLGMVGLARSAAEERKFRAMVYLLDPDHDARLMKPMEGSSEERLDAPPGWSGDLAECLQWLRRDRRREASVAAQRPNVKEQFEHIKKYLDYDEFVKLCADRGPLTADQLRRILLAEASLIRVPDGPDASAPAAPSATETTWSQIMAKIPPATTVPSLSLETLTEFNPAECEYRDGKWVAP